MIIDGYLEKGVRLSMEEGILPSEILAAEQAEASGDLEKAGRAGLVKKMITDSRGHRTSRWVRAGAKESEGDSKKDGDITLQSLEAEGKKAQMHVNKKLNAARKTMEANYGKDNITAWHREGYNPDETEETDEGNLHHDLNSAKDWVAMKNYYYKKEYAKANTEGERMSIAKKWTSELKEAVKYTELFISQKKEMINTKNPNFYRNK